MESLSKFGLQKQTNPSRPSRGTGGKRNMKLTTKENGCQASKPKSIVQIIAEGLDLAGGEQPGKGFGGVHLWAVNLANAAPDLLEALEAALPFIPHAAKGAEDVLNPVLGQIRAAIRKAKGGAK